LQKIKKTEKFFVLISKKIFFAKSMKKFAKEEKSDYNDSVIEK
jgi:hypothetical protein